MERLSSFPDKLIISNMDKGSSFFSGKISADPINFCLITILWILMTVLVNPIGNFPLNDDWAYGWTVKNLLDTGQFELADWTATNLLPQALWGTLFCLPFGFSFTALRISTLVLGLLGVVTTYGLLREAGTKSGISLLGSLLVALNPIYFGLSNSFNSDVPSFTLSLMSVYFLVRGLRLGSTAATITGLIIAFLAILNRQSSIIILPAYGIAYLACRGLKFKNFLKAFWPTLAGLLINAAYSYWLDFTKQKPLLYGFQIEKLMETFVGGPNVITTTYGYNVCLFFIYSGLFLLPFLVVQFARHFKNLPVRGKLLSLCFTFLLLTVGLVLVWNGMLMPLVGNVLEPVGLGPSPLNNYFLFEVNRYFRAAVRLWRAFLLLAGCLGASLLFQYLLIAIKAVINRGKKTCELWLLLFLFICTLLYFLPIGGISKDFWFDRYLIMPLPLLMCAISILTPPFSDRRYLRRSIAFFSYVGLFCYGVFTVSATHDYLAANRVRWFALDNLMGRSHVLPSQIGGGFEFNGWYHMAAKLKTCNPDLQLNGKDSRVDWDSFSCLWDDANREYTIQIAHKDGYHTLLRYPFRRWLPWREESFYILRKNSLASAINRTNSKGKGF